MHRIYFLFSSSQHFKLFYCTRYCCLLAERKRVLDCFIRDTDVFCVLKYFHCLKARNSISFPQSTTAGLLHENTQMIHFSKLLFIVPAYPLLHSDSQWWCFNVFNGQEVKPWIHGSGVWCWQVCLSSLQRSVPLFQWKCTIWTIWCICFHFGVGIV